MEDIRPGNKPRKYGDRKTVELEAKQGYYGL